MSPSLTDLKPDWNEMTQRMTAWWAGAPLDRAVAAVTAPRAGVECKPLINTVPEIWIDLDTLVYNAEAQMEATFYGGEAFPCHWLYHGPVPASAYFGCVPHFRPETVWYSPCYDNWAAAETWEFDPANEWWQMALRLTREIVERARGRFLVSGLGVCGLADVIANMWGSEALLMQLAEDRQVIRRLLGRMTAVCPEMCDELAAIVQPGQEGSFDWMKIWGPGRVFTGQNDMSCMVSPAMFREVFLEEIRQEVDHADHGIYHLDGPGALAHLDALLSLENLHCIQWVPGVQTYSASPDPLEWLDVYRRIQAAGKRALIYCAPEQVTRVLSQLDRRLVYLGVRCPDEATARSCLRELERLGA